jgi:transcriptional/translational regulatory protein YebC/TACO1
VVTTDPQSLHAVQKALETAGHKAVESEIAHIAKTTVHVEGKNAESLVKLLEELEDLDDVQKVAANFDMDVEQMSSA